MGHMYDDDITLHPEQANMLPFTVNHADPEQYHKLANAINELSPYDKFK